MSIVRQTGYNIPEGEGWTGRIGGKEVMSARRKVSCLCEKHVPSMSILLNSISWVRKIHFYTSFPGDGSFKALHPFLYVKLFGNLVAALWILSRWCMYFLSYEQFAWMACSRCGLTNELYKGTKISFVGQINDLL